MKGQLSAEMLVLMVVVLAIVAIASMQLIGTAKGAGKQASSQSQDLLDRSSDAIKSQSGEACQYDGDCDAGSCDTTTYTCS